MLKPVKKFIVFFLASSSVIYVCDANANNVWSVSASALYLQPSFGGNGLGYSSFGNYAGADNQQVIRTTNNINYIYNVQPDRALGFQLGVAYHYTCVNDLTLDWYHLNESVNGELPGTTMFSGSVDGFYAGDLELRTRWDAVNLELSQDMHWRTSDLVKLHAGLGYVRIRNTFTNHPKLFLNGSPYFNSTDTISYTGIGPRFGIDFSHMFNNGLNVYLKTAGSLLLGTSRQSVNGYINVVNKIYGTIPYGTNNFVSSDSNVVVPEVEAKLGVGYEYKLPNESTLDFNLGYMWMTYMRAMVVYTGIGIVGSSIGVPSTTHFDLNGGYFSLAWNV